MVVFSVDLRICQARAAWDDGLRPGILRFGAELDPRACEQRCGSRGPTILGARR